MPTIAGCLGIGSPIPNPFITQHSMSKPKQQQVVAYLAALPLADDFALAPAFGVDFALAFPSGVIVGRCLFGGCFSAGGAVAKRFCRAASVMRDLWQCCELSCFNRRVLEYFCIIRLFKNFGSWPGTRFDHQGITSPEEMIQGYI